MKLVDLFEAPLADISFHGKDVAVSFSPSDLKLMKKFAVEKIYHEKLKKLPFSLYIYILNDEWLDDLGRVFPKGRSKLKI